jgi:hypothetical protein
MPLENEGWDNDGKAYDRQPFGRTRAHQGPTAVSKRIQSFCIGQCCGNAQGANRKTDQATKPQRATISSAFAVIFTEDTTDREPLEQATQAVRDTTVKEDSR